MKIYVAIVALLVSVASAQAEYFFQHGPIGCSSPLPVVQEMGPNKQFRVRVTLEDGTVKTYEISGHSDEVSYRKLPLKAHLQFGPKKIITCTVDTSIVTGVVCSDYPTKGGWGGQCSYCATKDGQERCWHAKGKLVPVKELRAAR